MTCKSFFFHPSVLLHYTYLSSCIIFFLFWHETSNQDDFVRSCWDGCVVWGPWYAQAWCCKAKGPPLIRPNIRWLECSKHPNGRSGYSSLWRRSIEANLQMVATPKPRVILASFWPSFPHLSFLLRVGETPSPLPWEKPFPPLLIPL